ncbi:MAG: NTP transferase domain-containing protein [Pseudomonadota bacterium]
MSRSKPIISTATLPIDALVLAGRRSGEADPLATVDNVPHKALLIAGGKPLIRRVVEALRSSERIASILIAAPQDVRGPLSNALDGVDGWSFADTEGSPAKTVLALIESLAGEHGLLVTTCDHALLSRDMIRTFLREAQSADAAAACVDRKVYEARFPGSRRTFIRLKDLSFSGANLFWFAGARAKSLADFWRRLETKRKNPAAMAREIGVFTALSYLMGQMTKAGLERTLRRKTKVNVRLVTLQTAEAAIDVDKPEDLVLVRSILALN